MAAMRVNVKPLTHWLIYKGYRVRFTRRSADRAEGVLTTGAGEEVAFVYDSADRVVHLPHERIHLNEHGWELGSIREETTACE